MDCKSWGVSFSSCRNSVFKDSRLLMRSFQPLVFRFYGVFTYFAILRAAVACEIPSSLATATVVPQRR